MNDLDLVRAMRAAAPEPGRDQLAAGRARLCAALAPAGQRPYRPLARRGRRPAAVLAAGLAVAAAVAAGVVLRPVSEPGAAPEPARPHGIRLVSAVAVLDKAAAAAQQRPAVLPGPHQWIYVKGVKKGPAGTFTMQSWQRFDGERSADIEHGKVVVLPYGSAQDGVPDATPQGAADYLRALPTAPKALLAAIYRKVDAEPRSQWYGGRDATAFFTLMTLLTNAPAGVPAAIQAAVFRAAADIPGVQVSKTTDALGRPAIGVTVAPLTGWFLLDPATYALTGLRSGSAVLTRLIVAVVSQPGQR